MPGWLGAGPGEPGRKVGGDGPPFPEDSRSWQPGELAELPPAPSSWGSVYGGLRGSKWGVGGLWGLREGGWQQSRRIEGMRAQEGVSCVSTGYVCVGEWGRGMGVDRGGGG